MENCCLSDPGGCLEGARCAVPFTTSCNARGINAGSEIAVGGSASATGTGLKSGDVTDVIASVLPPAVISALLPPSQPLCLDVLTVNFFFGGRGETMTAGAGSDAARRACGSATGVEPAVPTGGCLELALPPGGGSAGGFSKIFKAVERVTTGAAGSL